MAIYKLGSVVSTGLLATTLLVGGCNNPTVGPAGAPGTNGTDGITPVVLPVLKTAKLNVTCTFDHPDVTTSVARDPNKILVTAQAVDPKFNTISGIVTGWGYENDDGVATLDSPQSFVLITCRDTHNGESMTAYANVTGGVSTETITVDPVNSALWTELKDVFVHNGYKLNNQFSNADFDAIAAVAHDDSDLYAAWEAGDLPTNADPSAAQADARNAAVHQVIADGGASLLLPFANAPVCSASAAGTWEFDRDGDAVADLDDLGGDADYTMTNDALGPECALTEIDAEAITVTYTVNGVANTDNADSCNSFVSIDDRLVGAVGTSAADSVATGATASWYAVRLFAGADSDTHVAADAVYFGASLNCSEDTDADCDLADGSNIAVALPAALDEAVHCSDDNDYSDTTECTVGDTTNAFVLSATPRADLDSATDVLWVVKNCAPSEDTAFTYDGAGLVTLTTQNDVVVAAEAAEKNGHFGFVVAKLDPADLTTYAALLRLSRQNSNGDAVAEFTESLLDGFTDLTTLSNTPLETAINLAQGNGLCDGEVVGLSGDDFVVGAAVAKPNFAAAGLPFGETATVTCPDATTSETVVNENGMISARCAATAGQSISVVTDSITTALTCSI